MALSGKTFLALAFVFALVDIGSCLQCYLCSVCNDPFDKEANKLYTCGGSESKDSAATAAVTEEAAEAGFRSNTYHCYKYSIKGDIISRGCTTLNNYCELTAGLLKCSLCEEDGCNGAAPNEVFIPLPALAFMLSYLYWKQY